MSDPQPPKQINIELPKDVNATYANFAIISHSPHELIIDFAQILPAMPKARVQARILLTPINAKMLHQALGDNLAKYERRFGVIGSHGIGGFDPRTGTLGGLQWTVGSEDEGGDDE